MIIFSDTSVKTILQNCLYISEFKVNLISVQKLIKNYKVVFNEYCEIYTRDVIKLISRAKVNNRLFSFSVISNIAEIANTTISSTSSASTIQIDNALKIHRRLGHIGLNAMKKLPINGLHGITHLICQDCILAKATKHINHDFSEIRHKREYLNLIRSNFFGLVQVLSFDKKRYFIIFLNEAYK